jgi:hypothetical protein
MRCRGPVAITRGLRLDRAKHAQDAGFRTSLDALAT